MLTRKDFKRVDHHWVAAIDGTILSVESHGGVWRLYVYGALAELPKAEDNKFEPSDKHWQFLVKQAGNLEQVKRIAVGRE